MLLFEFFFASSLSLYSLFTLSLFSFCSLVIILVSSHYYISIHSLSSYASCHHLHSTASCSPSLHHPSTTSIPYSAVQYFGFTVTPVLGAIVAAIGGKNKMIIPLIHITINEYSLPALFVGFMAAANVLILYYCFDDKAHLVESVYQPLSDTAISSSATATTESATTEAQQVNQIAEDNTTVETWLSTVYHMDDMKKVIIGSCLLNIAMKGTIGVFETLGSEFVTRTFHWDSLQAGYTFASFGFFGVFCLLSFPLFQILGVRDIDLIAVGAVLMTLSCFLLSADHR